MNESELEKPVRLDQYVVSQHPSLSRSYAVHLIEQGNVLVNGEANRKAGYKLRPLDTVTIQYDEQQASQIPTIDIPVLYEDNDCVVIDKPSGLLTHSKGAFNPEATVATWLQARTSGMDGDRAGIVHRLDRATSGVMICAKTPEALSWLQKQFSQRKVKKSYQAIITGHLPQERAVIDMPIERNPKRPQTFRVGVNGKSALTRYSVVEANDKYSEILLQPETGRTHQLRVHMAQLGHPIVGDTLYGGQTAERLMLHAYDLEITLPNRERQTFHSTTPAIFKDLVSNA